MVKVKAKKEHKKRKMSPETRKKVLSKERNSMGGFNAAGLKRAFRRRQEERDI